MNPPDDQAGKVVPMTRRARPAPKVQLAALPNPVIVALDLEAKRIADDFAERHFAPPHTRRIAAALDVCALRNSNDRDGLRRARRALARVLIAQESHRP